MVKKAQDIRRRLGGRRGFSELFPERPKGMHHETYERLLEKARELVGAYCVLATRELELDTRKLERMLGRVGRR
jgi:hypothetical protein